jgi:hypothetical protein
VSIVRRALEEPMRQLAVNAGKDGAVIVDNVRRQQNEQDDLRVGYDVLREVCVNMVRQGIIDPVKVTRSAVENAASIGAMILTTEALITDIPEQGQPQMPPMPEYQSATMWNGGHVPAWGVALVLKSAYPCFVPSGMVAPSSLRVTSQVSCPGATFAPSRLAWLRLAARR